MAGVGGVQLGPRNPAKPSPTFRHMPNGRQTDSGTFLFSFSITMQFLEKFYVSFNG
jgi:hypothetical protein